MRPDKGECSPRAPGEAFVALALAVTGVACGAASRTETGQRGAPSVVINEAFAHPETIQREWFASMPETVGAAVSIEGETARLALPVSGELKLSRLLDVAMLRGKRLRVSARIRTDAAGASARVSMLAGCAGVGDREQVAWPRGSHESWSSSSAIVDIDPGVLRIELGLVLRGKGNAWFDDVRVEVLGSAPIPTAITLTARQNENIEVLARAVALIRYRHPSDQGAKLDWDAFLPDAVARVMRARDRGALIAELGHVFGLVAPTVEFSESAISSPREPIREGIAHLARWRHFGGPSAPYRTWREGIDADLANVDVEVLADVPDLSRCKAAQLKAVARQLDNGGTAILYADIGLPGRASKLIEHSLNSSDTAVSVDIEVPADAFNLRLGVRVKGRTGFELRQLGIVCAGRARVDVNVGSAAWLHRGMEDLFTYATTDCASGKCLVVQRKPLDTSFVQSRDALDAEIAKGLWIHVPLAVWTDGRRTLPETGEWRPTSTYATTDAATRLAMIASGWGTLSLFYPYFSDLHIDWSQELPRGIARMAAARSLIEIMDALSSLVIAIHDNHSHIYHPRMPIDGILPIALRRFGNTFIVVGALDDYREQIPIGTEILAIDDVPVLRAYDEVAGRISSATAGWSAAKLPYGLTLGGIGTLSSLDVKLPDGKVSKLVLPHPSRDLHDSLVREPRPTFGAEVASGVYYIDLEDIKIERWQSIVPALTKARAIVLDMRGYPGNAVFDILGHFSDRELRSPEWQIPHLEDGGFWTSFWTIRPMKPRLTAKVICLLDGRAASAAETFLQIVHENHLASLVGEASSGTNGNPTVVSLPGGFSLRFTAMRVPLQDGTALHGRGIVPDHVVHPTLEGMRAGRDEILEAALGLVNRL